MAEALSRAQILTVGFLSLTSDRNVKSFVDKIKSSTLEIRREFVKLTVNDLKHYKSPKDFHAVVLLHSVSEGRFCVTDVTDAKYNLLLTSLHDKYGRNRVAVIVHSMPRFDESTKEIQMMMFEDTQPTTFQCSNCVVLCGKLSEMPDLQRIQLVNYLVDAPNHPLPEQNDNAEESETSGNSPVPEKENITEQSDASKATDDCGKLNDPKGSGHSEKQSCSTLKQGSYSDDTKSQSATEGPFVDTLSLALLETEFSKDTGKLKAALQLHFQNKPVVIVTSESFANIENVHFFDSALVDVGSSSKQFASTEVKKLISKLGETKIGILQTTQEHRNPQDSPPIFRYTETTTDNLEFRFDKDTVHQMDSWLQRCAQEKWKEKGFWARLLKAIFDYLFRPSSSN